MLNGWVVKFKFEVGEAKVIVKLCIFLVKVLCFFKGLNGIFEFALFVQSYSIIEKALE
jgi:hypothetical protein